MANLNLDVVIVGAGFSGCLSLHEFRKRGFNVKIIEAGDDLGGVWYWNHYPGVQVDSLPPLYQFTDPELWKDFSFTTLYPSGDEVLRYFEHLDSKLELRKDIAFGNRVTSARYIDRQWQLQTDKDLEVKAPMVVWAVGTTNKQLFPQWKGLSSFKGQVIHAARWPKDFDLKGKRIGLVGQGSTGVQIVERLSKQDCQVTVFVRTPPIALPARQKTYSEEDIREAKATYPKQFYDIQTTHMPYAPRLVSYHDDTPEQRQALWEAGWKEGGLAFGSCNYYDIVLDKEANRGIYDFWERKVRERIKDPAKRDIVAPLVPVSSLE